VEEFPVRWNVFLAGARGYCSSAHLFEGAASAGPVLLRDYFALEDEDINMIQRGDVTLLTAGIGYRF